MEVEGIIPWCCLGLRLSTICIRNSQSQTKEIGKVFPLSALQILKIAIKHLHKISRWWQGKENDQSQALLNPLNITYGLDVAVTRHSLILGEFSGRALFFGTVTTAKPDNIVERREGRRAEASMPEGIAVPGDVTSMCVRTSYRSKSCHQIQKVYYSDQCSYCKPARQFKYSLIYV